MHKRQATGLLVLLLGCAVFGWLLAGKPDLLPVNNQESLGDLPPDEFGNTYSSGQAVRIRDGATPWQLFARTIEKPLTEEQSAALETQSSNSSQAPSAFKMPSFFSMVLPEFQPEIIALENTKIRLMGFMFPMQAAEQQQQFLLGPFPMSCPYHYHVSPRLSVIVEAPQGVDFSIDPVLVEGTLQLRRGANDQSFYTLADARFLKRYRDY